ncbi:protein of unknown function DUF302 [Spirochaeta thermophila DSM 6578]|uniref:DUF302 domain-containing protein n=1 Tax=Winmispira thermophila (strain ATCC 700085 / DSM 6578 / Z-1203) TaxID=869211 RepID=G0GAN8_WINT7|nr:DUF302 domain-containing protein [Spirochaeta thermophila]AEJ61003.1 protein of unknown function DUF302 [Spirochaeta thermophila DSM 6578]
MDTSYAMKKRVARGVKETCEMVKEALSREGFGILCEIDVQATLRAKLGKEVEPYVILGACNPPLAHQALSLEEDIGLMLPCNVVVYRKEGHTVVAAIRPTKAMEVVGNPRLLEVASQVEEKLARVIDHVG